MKGARILVVDDEPSNQFLLEGLLDAYGYNPIIVSGGKECLDLLETEIVDLILLDIMMPRMSGLEVLAQIMKSDKWKIIPVIMVSAKTTSPDIQEALNEGAIDYIKKPFDEMELLARVRVGLRLKENEDKLREMIRLRNDFVKIVSHDLRSPFTAIHGFAGILAKAENLTAKQKESLKYIIQSVEYSDDYFNKLLSWTLLDHGDLKLMLSEVELHSLVETAIRIFTDKAEGKEIRIENHIEPSLKIQADETYLRQVIANLVNNGIKFTPEGGIIRIMSAIRKEGIDLIVTDNGIGMPDSVTSENLFVDTIAATRKGTQGERGTGIGLSICKKIMDAHKFGFSFERNMDGGTRFIIQIGTVKD